MKLSILYSSIFNVREDFTADIVIHVTQRQKAGVNDRSALHYSIFETGFGTHLLGFIRIEAMDMDYCYSFIWRLNICTLRKNANI
jgi:hypothetical protein